MLLILQPARALANHGIAPGRKVSSYSGAIDFFQRGSVSGEMQTVRRDAWVENASERKAIKERSRAMRTYKSVLSLLWIPYELQCQAERIPEPTVGGAVKRLSGHRIPRDHQVLAEPILGG